MAEGRRSVSAPGQSGIGPGPPGGLEERVLAPVAPRTVEKPAQTRGHRYQDVLDISDTGVFHQPFGLDSSGAVVPAEGEEQVTATLRGDAVEIPCVARVRGERLLAQDIGARLQRRFDMLVVETGGAGHDHRVESQFQCVPVVVADMLESEPVPKHAQRLAVGTHGAHQFDIVPGHQSRDVVGNRPRPGPDDSDPSPPSGLHHPASRRG